MRGGARRYLIHGVTVESELELDAHPSPKGEPLADFRVRSGPRREGSGQPEGTVLAKVQLPHWAFWLVDRGYAEWLLRFGDLADFVIFEDEIEARPADEELRDLIPVLICGGVLAQLICARGELVLHASAVELSDGRALAILAPSGGGKSTTAAQLCLAGAPLVTDDTLAVSLTAGNAIRCHRGTRSIRLRDSARTGLPNADVFIRGRFPDQRLMLCPPASEHEELELGALVVLERHERPAPIEVERLAGYEAVTALLKNQRSLGWQEPARIASFFRLASELAARAPIFRCRLSDYPRGGSLGADLSSAIEDEITRGDSAGRDSAGARMPGSARSREEQSALVAEAKVPARGS